MSQAVDFDLLLYADNTCLLYQHKDLDQINKELTKNKNFCNICDWFLDNKLSIHFEWMKLNLSFSLPKTKRRKLEH